MKGLLSNRKPGRLTTLQVHETERAPDKNRKGPDLLFQEAEKGARRAGLFAVVITRALT